MNVSSRDTLNVVLSGIQFSEIAPENFVLAEQIGPPGNGLSFSKEISQQQVLGLPQFLGTYRILLQVLDLFV